MHKYLSNNIKLSVKGLIHLALGKRVDTPETTEEGNVARKESNLDALFCHLEMERRKKGLENSFLEFSSCFHQNRVEEISHQLSLKAGQMKQKPANCKE